MFFKVGRVFKNFTNFPAALLKRDSKPGVYFTIFLRATFFTEHFQWLLLNVAFLVPFLRGILNYLALLLFIILRIELMSSVSSAYGKLNCTVFLVRSSHAIIFVSANK